MNEIMEEPEGFENESEDDEVMASEEGDEDEESPGG
jgi:hypothetical protein